MKHLRYAMEVSGAFNKMEIQVRYDSRGTVYFERNDLDAFLSSGKTFSGISSPVFRERKGKSSFYIFTVVQRDCGLYNRDSSAF